MTRLSLEELLLANDLALSRTVLKTHVDNSASTLKLPSLVTGDQLAKAIVQNRAMIARFIRSQYRNKPSSSHEITGALLTLAFITNLGISPGGLFRQWPYDTQVKELTTESIAPENIPTAMWPIGDQLLQAFELTGEADKLAIVGGVEWEIGIGPLHPFYDGCGRVSRYFSAMNSLWLGVPVIRHASRDRYMGQASVSKSAFIEYYLTQYRVLPGDLDIE